jgi:hypothetical protein
MRTPAAPVNVGHRWSQSGTLDAATAETPKSLRSLVHDDHPNEHNVPNNRVREIPAGGNARKIDRATAARAPVDRRDSPTKDVVKRQDAT